MTSLRDLRVPFVCFVFVFFLALPDERREAYAASAALAEDREAYAPQSAPGDSPKPAPVFSRDVAPIIFEACTPCHRAGGPGPFSLASYHEVRQRATQVLQVTRSRFMPPWKVDPAIGHFEGQRPVTDAEISLLEEWVAGGTPEGDPALTPGLPAFPDGWLLGTPDLVVTLPTPFVLPADPTDSFRIFAIPIPVSKRALRARDRVPSGQPARRSSREHPRRPDRPRRARLDEADPAARLRRPDAAHSAEYPDGHFLGWTPGQVAPLLPGDLAWTLEPGTDLVVQLHMQPTGTAGAGAADDRPLLRRRSARRGRRRCCGSDRRASTSRRAKDLRDYAIRTCCRWTWTCWPCSRTRTTARRRSSGTATLPDGRTQRVMHIRDWDFRWQHVYRLRAAAGAAEGHDACRWSTPTTTRRRTSRNPEVAAASGCCGASVRRTKWATSGSSCCRKPRSDRERLNAEISAEDADRGHHRLRDDAHGRSRRPRTARRCGAALPRDGEAARGREALPARSAEGRDTPRRRITTWARRWRSPGSSMMP